MNLPTFKRSAFSLPRSVMLISVLFTTAMFGSVAQADSLTTIFASNNGFAGNSFDVEVVGASPITIDSFEVNIDSPRSQNTVAIYWREGTSQGYLDSSAGWVLMGKDTNVVSNGPENPTPVAVGGLVMLPGKVYGIYVDLESYDPTRMLYTTGGPQDFDDSNIKLTTFTGQASPAFSGQFFPRIWNGTINYTLGAGGDTRFRVTKDFLDDYPDDVTVMLSCNTGLILEQDFDLGDGEMAEFVVEDFKFEDGFWCEITESGAAGYVGSFVANGGTADDSCYYTAGENGNIEPYNTCAITNQADFVKVTIGKDWVIPQDGGYELDTDVYVDVMSEGEIKGGTPCNETYSCIRVDFSGVTPVDQVVEVRPEYGGTDVVLTEGGFDQAAEIDSTCGTGITGTVEIKPAMPASCVFTNTVFFEGIPTLNQYGLMILALLTLGVGAIGFRRFV